MKILLTAVLVALASPALAQTSCRSDEGCCINGVQHQVNFFPFCSKTRKTDCIWPSKAFQRASLACKRGIADRPSR